METTPEIKTIRCHYYQAKAVRSTARFVGLIAGTGGGKTYTGPMWLYQEIEKYPDDQFIVVAPTYRMLTRATVPTLVDIFRGTKQEGELKLSQGVYVTRSGARVYLGSGDRPEGLEAGQYRAAWLDEAGQMKFQVWIVIQARLGMHEGRALITTTPYAVNWLYHEFYKRWLTGDKDYEVVQFPSTQNPFYPQAEFDRARRAMTTELFEMRYCGQFRKMEGLIYPDFCQDHIVDPFPIPNEWRKAGGIDFGWNNPFVILKGAVDPDDILYIYEEHYYQGKLLDFMAEKMKDGLRYWADPSGKREIMELRQKGIDARAANNDVAAGIEKVNARTRTHRIRYFKTCKHTIEEKELYAWEEGKDKPHKEDDHCMDGERYLVMGVDGRIGRPRIRQL